MTRADRRVRVVLGPILLALASTHVLLSWGNISVWWGDTGRWLHEVDRFVTGETLYQDFYWPFPPLALWLLGSIGKLAGSGIAVMFGACSVVFLLIAVRYAGYVSLLDEDDDLQTSALTAVTALLLATGLASGGGSTLSAGMYSPAAPIGFLFVLLALVLSAELPNRKGATWPFALGVLCAAAILTKQDFWLPALSILGLTFLRDLRERDHRRPIIVACSFVLVLGLGLGAIAYSAGAGAVLAMAVGGGSAGPGMARGLPSLERLTLEVTILAGLIVLVSSALLLSGATERRTTRRWILMSGGTALLGVMTFLFMTMRNEPGVVTAVRVLRDEILRRPLPAILPVVVLALAMTRLRPLSSPKNQLLTGLLVVCVFARARRLFESTEWFHALLELPVYVAVAGAVWPLGGRRAARYVMVLLLFFGIYTYWEQGRGWLTERGHQFAMDTGRGVVRVSEDQVKTYERLSAALESVPDDRPLFAFGYTGGFNYFLGRTNPAHTTESFSRAYIPVTDVLAEILALPNGLLLLDSRAFERVERPLRGLDLRSWKLRRGPHDIQVFDRPLFEQIAAKCVTTDTLFAGAGDFLVLSDCRW